MRRGAKPKPRAVKAAQGTLQPQRDVFASMPAADGEVVPPEGSMTGEAQMVWDLHAPIAIAAGMLKPADAEQFAIYCNLTAFIRQCHRSGDPAPAAHYAEQRRQAELFGLAGERSRSVKGAAGAKQNAFARNGARPGIGGKA